jgi:hypothetical protein
MVLLVMWNTEYAGEDIISQFLYLTTVWYQLIYVRESSTLSGILKTASQLMTSFKIFEYLSQTLAQVARKSLSFH